MPNIQWIDEPPTSSPFSTLAKEFLDMGSVFSLTQLVIEPTRITNGTAHTLDLALSNVPDLICNLTHLPGLRDHSIVMFSLKLLCPKTKNRGKPIRNYNRANFQAINNELCAILDAFLDGFDDRTVETKWRIFPRKSYRAHKQVHPYSLGHFKS